MSTRPSTSFLLILQMESLELDANISPMHSQHQPKWGTRPPATGSVSGSSVRIGWSVSPGSRTSCAGGLGRTNAYSLPLSMALGIPAIPAGMTSGGRQTSPLKNYPLPLRCPHKPAAAQRAHNFLYSPRPRSVTGRARCARSRSPSRTVSSARWVYQPSGTGWCGRQQPWCRRRSLRLTCNRSSRPTGRAATLRMRHVHKLLNTVFSWGGKRWNWRRGFRPGSSTTPTTSNYEKHERTRTDPSCVGMTIACLSWLIVGRL